MLYNFEHLCICVHVYIHMLTHQCIYIYTNTDIYLYTHMSIYTYLIREKDREEESEFLGECPKNHL